MTGSNKGQGVMLSKLGVSTYLINIEYKRTTDISNCLVVLGDQQKQDIRDMNPYSDYI